MALKIKNWHQSSIIFTDSIWQAVLFVMCFFFFFVSLSATFNSNIQLLNHKTGMSTKPYQFCTCSLKHILADISGKILDMHVGFQEMSWYTCTA